MILISTSLVTSEIEYSLNISEIDMAGVAQWIECRPMNQRVAGSILSQGTCLNWGPGQV